MLCSSCDKDFRDDDCAPYLKQQDGTFLYACRKCIAEWIKLGILWATIPFWKRREGF